MTKVNGKLFVKTRVACVLIVFTGIILTKIATYYAFHQESQFASLLNCSHIAFLLLVPIALFFLRGERPWRLAVFGIWLAYVGILAYTMLTMS